MKVKQGAFLVLMIWVVLTGCIAAPATQFDPNGFAIGQGLTAQAAQNNQTYYGQMATATHEAPIMAITQRAADLNFAMTENSMRTTQTASLWTATPSPYPTITPSPTPDAPMTATFSALFAMQTQTVLDTQRQEISNQFWAIVTPLFLIVLLAIVILAAVTAVRQLRHRPIARDEFGKTQPLLDTASGRYINLDASPNYSHEERSILQQAFIQWLERKYGFVLEQPRITAERQDRTKEREQIIELERNRKRLPKALIDAQTLRFLPGPAEESGEIPVEAYPELPLPQWTDLNRWDGKLLPVGQDEQQKLMLVDPTLRPHLMYVGRSRSGKTLTGERTAAACLLTQGWNVIVMGKRVDWMPFVDHPNFKLLAVDVRKDAQKYIDLLQIISAQMDIRDVLMAAKHVTTWDRYGAPSTMVIIDDYSGALLRMPKINAAQVTAEVRSIAMDGAKFGLSLTLGLQDATAQNVDTTTRSQMARIVYSLDNATKSRIALGTDGAERLPPFRHFLTRVTDESDVRRGVGFFLQDREVEAFLASRPVAQNGELEWIEGTFTETPESLPARESVQLTPQSTPSVEARANFSQKVIELAESVRAQWNPGMRKSETSRLFGRPNAGAWSETLDQIYRYLSSTSTPENGPILPDAG